MFPGEMGEPGQGSQLPSLGPLQEGHTSVPVFCFPEEKLCKPPCSSVHAQITRGTHCPRTHPLGHTCTWFPRHHRCDFVHGIFPRGRLYFPWLSLSTCSLLALEPSLPTLAGLHPGTLYACFPHPCPYPRTEGFKPDSPEALLLTQAQPRGHRPGACAGRTPSEATLRGRGCLWVQLLPWSGPETPCSGRSGLQDSVGALRAMILTDTPRTTAGLDK